jgi:hypothetical protein
MANDQVSNEMKAILSARFPGNEADMEIPADEEELRFEAAWTELLKRRRAAKHKSAGSQSKALRVAPEEQEVEEAEPPTDQFTSSGPAYDEIRVDIDFDQNQSLKRKSKRPSIIRRTLAASLIIGGGMAYAAARYPSVRRAILELFTPKPKVQPKPKAVPRPKPIELPLIPPADTVDANRLRKRIDDLRILSGDFLGGYRLQWRDDRLIWYFDNMGLLATCQTKPIWVRDYLSLYLGSVNPRNGTIRDVQDISSVVQAASDSDASYAATMLSLAARYYRVSGDRLWLSKNKNMLKLIAQKIILDSQKASGLVASKVDPKLDKIARLIDNCQVYRGLSDFSAMLEREGDPIVKKYEAAADRVAEGIAGLYSESENAFQAADVESEAEFYPMRASQIYPEVYGVPLGDAAHTAQRYKAAWAFMNAGGDHWEIGKFKDASLQGYPWMILGYAAAKQGRFDLARKQLAYFLERLDNSSDAKFTAIHELGWAVQTMDLIQHRAPAKP